MICELQRKWSKTIIKRLNLQAQILSKMPIKLGIALRQSDVMLKHGFYPVWHTFYQCFAEFFDVFAAKPHLS